MPRTPATDRGHAKDGALLSVLSTVKPSVPRGTPPLDAAALLNETLANLDRVGLERMMTAGQLAGMFAHELSNILTPLLSYAQLALANPSDGALSNKALNKAADGAMRAAFLADALLGKRGGPDQRDRDVESTIDPLLSINPVACVEDSVRRALSTAFRAPGATMERARLAIHIDVESDLRAAAHPIALEHVLQNLITNARLAMRSRCADDSGEIRIVARALSPIGGSECSTGNTGDVEIRVLDTGPGVSEQVRARLFEPFVTSRAGQGGFGLGLAVCKRLIEQAGGTIHLAPAGIEDGAEFIITLPAARPSK
jgi:two-component system sensor kinase FixL